jgi:hypothetical protein
MSFWSQCSLARIEIRRVKLTILTAEVNTGKRTEIINVSIMSSRTAKALINCSKTEGVALPESKATPSEQ